MKCKVCESELRTGTKRCPHCGTEVPAAGRDASEVFKWNVQDFPQPKKNTEMSIDWSEGKIYNKSSGKVYSQTAMKWSEPEEVKTLFNFDKKNEEFQEVLDRQMDTFETVIPPTPSKIEEPMIFDLPASMDMGIFEELIGDDVDFIIPDDQSSITIEIDSPAIDFTTDEEPEKSDAMFSLDDIFEGSAADDSSADVVVEKEDKPAKSDDDIVFDGIRKLMEAEEKFKQDMERVTYLTPSEAEKVEKIEDNSNKLRFIPTDITVRSLEDEYQAYRAEKSMAEENAEQANEVKVEINEPSGTKVTVKTHEIPVEEDENCKTQEVQLENLVQGPKDVQVSIEVESAGGNASVEVTRKHDGSTVVKTTGESTTLEHVVAPVQEEPVAEDAEEAVAEEKLTIEDIAADVENKDFWEQSDSSNSSASRMTITDIFGPDARRIISGDDDDDSVLEESLILDIKPEDIAVTKEQTISIKTPAVEEKEEPKAEVKVEEAAVAAVVVADEETEKPAEEPVEETVAEEIPEVSVPEKKSGFGAGAKALIAILVIILLAEMSIIGIKLFAPDSKAGAVIENAQDYVVSVFKGDDVDVLDDAQDDINPALQQTNPTQQPADPANTAGAAVTPDSADQQTPDTGAAQ